MRGAPLLDKTQGGTKAHLMPRAALFDMDKTLIRVNTARLFTRYRRDRGESTALDGLRVGWWLLQYSVGRLDANAVARKALGTYKDTLEAEMFERCNEWFPEYVLPYISDRGREFVESHRKRGDRLIIATSATIYGADPLRRELQMDDVVCSPLEVQDGKITGEVVEPLCYGLGKKERVERLLTAQGMAIEEATFYTDSITDLPLLEAVGDPVAVNPDLRLAREAKKRGWKTDRW